MAERRTMLMGTRKAVAPLVVLALAGLGAAGCGSSSDDDTTAPKPPPVSAATANHLAELSDRIATDLDAGNTCDAAHSADELQGAVEDADLSATLRPGVEDVASRLVDEVNCPPPPPAPEPEKDKKKHDEAKKHEEHGGDEHSPPGHSGGVHPGKEKLKGESG